MPRQLTFDPNPGKLQDMVNTAINLTLINHSNVLSNTVYNVVVRTFNEGLTHNFMLARPIISQDCHRL